MFIVSQNILASSEHCPTQRANHSSGATQLLVARSVFEVLDILEIIVSVFYASGKGKHLLPIVIQWH